MEKQTFTLELTLERSTPVNACTAGGTCPTRRVSSPLVVSLPPRSTISSVLANGAATSAAICRRRNVVVNTITTNTRLCHNV